ncbi:outer membrane protein assembly factor BamB family protein [Marinilabilia sp.]
MIKNWLVICLLTIISLYGCKEEDSTLQFAHLTDIHVAPGSEAETNLKKVVKDINAFGVDFVVVTGDLTNTGSNAELMAAKKILDQLEVPYYAIPGNHETNWSESAGMKFNELWGNDRFTFTKGDFLFVGFNTGPYMKMGDGHVKQEDIRWLERTLKEKEDEQVLVSMAHYPLAEGLDNWTTVTELLKKYDCKMALCGHGHRLKLLNFDGIPGVMGRSLVMSGTEHPGFTLVELRNDSAFVFDKEPDLEPGKPEFKLSLRNPDTLGQLSVSPKPSFAVNKEYPDVEVAFEYNDTASVFTGPCLVDEKTIVYGNSLGFVKAIDLTSSEVKWEHQYQGALFSTPVTNGDVVAFGTVGGNIVGLDAASGRELWRVEVGTPVLAEGIVENDNLFIGGGQTAFFKIDLMSGDILWQFDDINGSVQGKPALGENEVIFGAWDRHLYSLKKQSGKLNWKWNNGTSVKLYSPGNIVPVVSDDKVFLVAPDRYMTALDLGSGEELWRSNIHQVRESMGKSPDGRTVYAKLMNDSIVAMSATASNIETLWSIDAGIGYDHNPCPVAANTEMVIGATKNGLVTAVSPDGKKVMWKYKAGNSSINKLVIDENSHVWLSLMEGRILKLKHHSN